MSFFENSRRPVGFGGGKRFDLVTAFETIYFWPGLADRFREVFRVTKPGGMTIYNAARILAALDQAGFTDGRV